jgi:hypothetical protein
MTSFTFSINQSRSFFGSINTLPPSLNGLRGSLATIRYRTMPPKKRKAASNGLEDNGERIHVRFVCTCEEEYGHASAFECAREQKLIVHKNIVAR